jgi:DNA-3-methyladenine glycosylase II
MAREGVPAHAVTWIVPPERSSLPEERARLEYSRRSIVFSDGGRRLRRAWGPPDRPWGLRVEARGSRWRVETWGASAREGRAAVRALFSLDHPLEAFYRLVRRDPVLRGTERRFRGLRLPRDASVYESLVHAIVGQQLSVRAADAIRGRLFDRAGSYLVVDGARVPCAPTPRRLGAVSVDELRSLGLSRAKAIALRALARWALRGSRTPVDLASAPREAAVAALDRLPGVGRWTAENALLRGTGRTDLFVAGDLGVRVALERYAAIPRSRPEADARSWADERYPGWGSYATLYLWRKFAADREDRTTD